MGVQPAHGPTPICFLRPHPGLYGTIPTLLLPSHTDTPHHVHTHSPIHLELDPAKTNASHSKTRVLQGLVLSRQPSISLCCPCACFFFFGMGVRFVTVPQYRQPTGEGAGVPSQSSASRKKEAGLSRGRTRLLGQPVRSTSREQPCYSRPPVTCHAGLSLAGWEDSCSGPLSLASQRLKAH